MQKWTTQAAETQDVAILLFPRFSNHCLANAVEPLRAANELLATTAYRWQFVTQDGGTVTSSSGLPVTPQGRLRDVGSVDYLFVISSYDAPALATPATARALRVASQRVTAVVGLDTGAWLMAHAGLLDDRSATIHWNELTAFSETFPAVDSRPDRYVIDGNRMTCGGAMTAFDFTLDLIRRQHGTALALEVSAFFLHQRTEAPAARIFRHVASEHVEGALALMSRHIEEPLPIRAIARTLGTTQRSLSRAFHNDLGTTPASAYKRLRLSTARRYVHQTRHPIAEIALRCGYTNAAALTRAFKQEFGATPSQHRART